MTDDQVPESLDKPAVGELIAALSKLPPETPVRIEDADTGWEITIIHFKAEDGKLFLYGEYSEM